MGAVTFEWVNVSAGPMRWGLGILALLSALALVYRFGPSVKTRLKLFSPGALFAVAMWVLTAFGFRFYIETLGAVDNYARTYGAVGGVAILMLLFYIDALFLLIGAEVNAEIDLIKLGLRSGDSPEEREVAPLPQYQLDEEDRELKIDLVEKRSVDEPAHGTFQGSAEVDDLEQADEPIEQESREPVGVEPADDADHVHHADK